MKFLIVFAVLLCWSFVSAEFASDLLKRLGPVELPSIAEVLFVPIHRDYRQLVWRRLISSPGKWLFEFVADKR
ncbi:MAG: hypothetical protein WCG27_00775 [Pseudomonadota bacterium]